MLVRSFRSAARSDLVASRYVLGQIDLKVQTDNAGLLVGIESQLGRFRVPTGKESVGRPFRLQVVDATEDEARCEPSPDRVGSLHEVWRGTNGLQLACVNYASEDQRLHWVNTIGQLEVDYRRRSATLRIRPNAVAHSRVFVTPLMGELHDRAGGLSLHAAALCREHQDGEQSILIVAASGSGKSTTALALTDDGWQLQGDDLSLVVQTSRGTQATGFPRPCGIRLPTLDVLPWLRDLPLQPAVVQDEFHLPLEALGRRASPDGRFAPLAAIYFLDKRNQTSHRIGRLDRATALIRLAHEAVQPVEGPADSMASILFGRSAELIATTPAFSLSVGPDLATLPTLLDDSLDYGLRRAG